MDIFFIFIGTMIVLVAAGVGMIYLIGKYFDYRTRRLAESFEQSEIKKQFEGPPVT